MKKLVGVVLAIMVMSLVTHSAYALEPCMFLAFPDQFSFGPSGGNGKIEVKASDPSCSFTVTADSPWIKLLKVETGDKGMVEFSVEAYQGEPPRIGTIYISGKAVNIMQFGAPVMAGFE